MFAVFCILALFVPTVRSYVVYSNGATSERNLQLCGGPREACNVIHKRFWFSPLIHRLCKCPDRTDCPSEWDGGQNKKTVAFNARAQLKFCSKVGELQKCAGRNTVAAEILSNGSISINCFCGKGYFFRRLYNDRFGYYFACVPYGTCKSEDFCGHITAHSYETYHTCTCPLNHLCLLEDRKLNHVKEFLYEGQAYSGYCILHEHKNQ